MKKLFWLFPILFLIDNVMGANGYQFTVFGIGIRILLFALSMVSLCLYCLLTIRQQNIALWKRQPDRPWFWSFVKPIDYFVLGFILWNLIWAIIVPRIMPGGNPADGLNEFDPLLVLALHFPCAFLLRTKQMDLRAALKWFIPLAALLALWHSVMYLGETAAPGFYMGYYDFIDKISFGTAVRTEVIIGVGITRIIQTTSVLMIPGMLLLLEYATEKKRFWPFVLLAPMLFGVLITYTKSIWFGILAGLIVAVVGFVICSKDRSAKKRAGAFFLVMTAMFFLFNNGVLHNTIITRTLNLSSNLQKIDSEIADIQAQMNEYYADATKPTDPTATPTEPVKKPDLGELNQRLEDLKHQREDATNTALSQALREEQDAALLGKWSESKWIGFGYGAYVKDCIRNVQFPFMYESLIPALLMKIGLVGMLGWGVFVAAMVYFAVKAMWKKPLRFWCWIGVGLAYAMAVQTNPFLFTFPGLSIMVYLTLTIVGEEPYECDPSVHL